MLCLLIRYVFFWLLCLVTVGWFWCVFLLLGLVFDLFWLVVLVFECLCWFVGYWLLLVFVCMTFVWGLVLYCWLLLWFDFVCRLFKFCDWCLFWRIGCLFCLTWWFAVDLCLNFMGCFDLFIVTACCWFLNCSVKLVCFSIWLRGCVLAGICWIVLFERGCFCCLLIWVFSFN